MASTVWRGHLTFGLISIPVRLFRAGRPERLSLRRVTRARLPEAESAATPEDLPERRVASPEPESVSVEANAGPPSSPLRPVRQANLTDGSPAPIPTMQVTHGIEVQKNHFVEIPREELKALKVETSQEMAIQQFVSLDQIDPLYFETSYYVVPEEVGEKAYSLLYQSLVNTKVVAVAALAMHGRDHVVIVRPGESGLIAHTMFYQNEVHLDEQFRADVSAVSAKELALAETLITSLTARFEPDVYSNQYQTRLNELVTSRVAAESASLPSTPIPRQRAAVVDIADALRASLAQLKKPAQGAGDSKPKTPSRRKSAGGAA